MILLDRVIQHYPENLTHENGGVVVPCSISRAGSEKALLGK